MIVVTLLASIKAALQIPIEALCYLQERRASVATGQALAVKHLEASADLEQQKLSAEIEERRLNIELLRIELSRQIKPMGFQ